MLENFIKSLSHELEFEENSLAQDSGTYTLPLSYKLKIAIKECEGGYMLKSILGSYPKINEESFLSHLMLGNLFGQGTRGATLGLSSEDQVTLTHIIDYPIDYKEFKEILEDFINTIDVWEEEISSHR